jgi:hypothetical protein
VADAPTNAPSQNEHKARPGLCAEHGGLMWSNAMRACITPDDVIRGGCQWRSLDPERPLNAIAPKCERCGHPLHRYRNLRLCRECEVEGGEPIPRPTVTTTGGYMVVGPPLASVVADGPRPEHVWKDWCRPTGPGETVCICEVQPTPGPPQCPSCGAEDCLAHVVGDRIEWWSCSACTYEWNRGNWEPPQK